MPVTAIERGGYLTEAVMTQVAYERFCTSVGQVDLPSLRYGLDYGGRRGAYVTPERGALPGWFDGAFEDFRKGVSDHQGSFFSTGGVSKFAVWASGDSSSEVSDLEFDLRFRNPTDSFYTSQRMVFQGRRFARHGSPAGIELSYRQCPHMIDLNGRLRPTHTFDYVSMADRRRTLQFISATQQMILDLIHGRIPAQVEVQNGDWVNFGGTIVPRMAPFNRAA